LHIVELSTVVVEVDTTVTYDTSTQNQYFYNVQRSDGSRKKYLGGLVAHRLGGNNG